jgi:DNA-binding MarR family transcriptional regulator
MDYEANIVARSLVDNHLDSGAYYTDADLILAIDHKNRLNSEDLLRLMQVRRAQRYRRLKTLKAYGLIDQRPDPYSPVTKRRRTIVVLTDLGKRVAIILKQHDIMKNWRFKIPARYIEKEPPKIKTPVGERPTRTSIYDILEDDDSQYLDDENGEDATDEDFDDDAKFEMEDFLKQLKQTTKDD